MDNYDIFLEDGDLLEIVETELAVQEASNTPPEIKQLNENIKAQINEFNKKNDLGFVGNVKRNLTNFGDFGKKNC